VGDSRPGNSPGHSQRSIFYTLRTFPKLLNLTRVVAIADVFPSVLLYGFT
jgi:hypothetical protein